jgi:hypothetical protein
MDAILKATEPDLRDSDITMVVSNLQMKAEFRTWTQRGAGATETAEEFLEQPDDFVEKHPAMGRMLALATAEPIAKLASEHASILRPRARQPFREVSDEFARRIRKLGSTPALLVSTLPAVRGSDVLLTPILRVGRTTPGGQITARLLSASGEPIEAVVPPDRAGILYEAARDDAPCVVTLDVVWIRVDGRLVADLRRACVRDVRRHVTTAASVAIGDFQAGTAGGIDIKELLDNIRGD